MAFYLVYRGLIITGITRPQGLLFRNLQESEARYRTILETAIEGFWRVDQEGRLLEVNEAYCRMCGYRQEELLGKRIADLEASGTPADAASHMQKAMAQGEHRFETRHRRQDGSILDLEVSVQHQPGAGKTIVAFLHDITERNQAEAALQESEERLRLLGDNLPESAVYQYMHEPDGRVRFLHVSAGIEAQRRQGPGSSG